MWRAESNPATLLTAMIDPRTEITHQIQAGQTYEDDRTGDELHLVYLDDKHVLLKEEQHARLLSRKDFETEVGAKRYKVSGKVETNADVAHTTIDFVKIDGIGVSTARNLQIAGYTTAEDIQRADRDDLLAVRGVGEGNLANIEEHITSLDNDI